jgi:hypothetical protein
LLPAGARAELDLPWAAEFGLARIAALAELDLPGAAAVGLPRAAFAEPDLPRPASSSSDDDDDDSMPRKNWIMRVGRGNVCCCCGRRRRLSL